MRSVVVTAATDRQRRHRGQLVGEVVGHRGRRVAEVLELAGLLDPALGVGGAGELDPEAERTG